VTDKDEEMQHYIQRALGYSLTGSIREHALFFAYGTGANGKGTLLNTVTSILGDYAVVSNADTFTQTGARRHLTELARLQGARFVVAQETEEGQNLAEARIKAITGGDPITANFMRQDHFTYSPQFKLWIAGNHKPALRNVDVAMRRRMNMLPFLVKIAVELRDKELTEKLKSEWAGILQWMVEGCIAWQQTGLMPPSAVVDATEDYFDAQDSLAAWIAECCQPTEYEGDSGALFKSWSGWARAAGEDIGSQKRFAQSLGSRGYHSKKGTGGKRMITGLTLVVPRPHHETENDR
jgi:putative DNA primase/helicase